MTGADLLCAELEAAGVTCVFGVPGTQNIPLYEALRRSGLRSVVATHELAASFMAGAYFRASGRVAPLVTIPGPGFTYALTGLAEALHDSAAVLHLVGAPPPGNPRSQFQGLDQRAIASPLVKGVRRIERPDEIPARVAEALDLAVLGEPGPVLLEWLPGALAAAPSGPLARPPRGRAPSPPPAQVDELRSLLVEARRPVLLVGQGAAEAAPLVQRLAEWLPAPVVTTCSGRGVLPEDHELSLAFDFPRGDVGRLSGFLRAADLVLVLGARLSSASTWDFALEIPADRLVQVDASEEVLGASYPGRLLVASTVELTLDRVLGGISPGDTSASHWTAAEVREHRRELRTTASHAIPEPIVHGVEPPEASAFFAVLARSLPRNGIVVADSGLHQLLARRHLEVLAPRGLIVPSDFQSMGFALPAAIGAHLGAPDRPIVALVGDGGLAMSGMELLTAVQERIPLTVVVFNDGWLNLIRIAQLRTFGHATGVERRNPDFGALAAAVGARFARVEGNAQEAVDAALGSRDVTLIELRVGDSGAMRRARARGLARGVATAAMGPEAVAWLKRHRGRA
ncbi:MAG: thiamine pyrophosphate-binding protein [Acidobacteria bacterium]|nr:thiamine pyrophosphate-binding protein [Acidobacteriota bacterium]